MLKLQKDLKIILSLLVLSNPFVDCGDDWLKTANDARKAASIPDGVQLKQLTNAREKHSKGEEIKAALKRTSYKRDNADAADDLAQTLATIMEHQLREKVAFGKKHKDSIPGEHTFVQGGGLFSHPDISNGSLIPFSFRVIKVNIGWFSNKTKWVDNLVDEHLVRILKDDNKVAPNTPELRIRNMKESPWDQIIGEYRCHLQYDNVSHFDYDQLMSPETESLLVGDNWKTLETVHGEQLLAHVVLYLKYPVEKTLSVEDCEYFLNKVNAIRKFSNVLLLDAEKVIKNSTSAEFISDLIYHTTPVFGNNKYRSGLINQGNRYSTYIELEAIKDESLQEIIGKAVDKVFETKTSNFVLNQTMLSWPPGSSKITMNDLSEYDLSLLLTVEKLGFALTRRESKNILVIDYYDVEKFIAEK